MAYTQVGIHHPDPDEVHVTTYEMEGMPRRSVQLSKGGTVIVYGDPAELMTFFETIVAKIKEGLEPEATTPDMEPRAALSQEDVIVRLRGDYAKRFPDADDFSAGYVDFEQRKVLEALERLGLVIVEPRAGEPMRGDRTFSKSNEVIVHQAGGPDLVVEADGILAHEAGDGHVMVAGHIVREVDGSLSEDEATPPPSDLIISNRPVWTRWVHRPRRWSGWGSAPVPPRPVSQQAVRFELPEGVQGTEPFADIDRTTEPDLIADRREDEDGERI